MPIRHAPIPDINIMRLFFYFTRVDLDGNLAVDRHSSAPQKSKVPIENSTLFKASSKDFNPTTTTTMLPTRIASRLLSVLFVFLPSAEFFSSLTIEISK